MKFKNITLIAALIFSVVAFFSCSGEKETKETAQPEAPVAEPAAKADTEPIVEEEPVVDTVSTEEASEEEPVKEENVEVTEKPAAKAPVKKAVVKEEAPKTEAKVEEPAQEKPAGAAKMDFEEWEFKFDEINQGDVVEHTFNFTNVGDAPLVISNARASCGCTVPEWPKEPIAPGAKSQIHVKFNSRGKRGMQNKSVTITTNYGKEVVYLKGNVKVPETTPIEGN